MEVLANAYHWLLILTLTVPRLLAIFLMLPFLGKGLLSSMARNGTAIILTVPVLPIVSQQALSLPFDSLFFIGLIAKEVAIGIIIGFLVGIIFWAVASTGSFIDNQRGAIAAGIFSPIIASPASPLGAFFALLTASLFLSTGGFLVLLSALYQSYIIWPVTSFFPEFQIQTVVFFLQQFDSLSYIAVLLAAPAMILMFITELSVALIGRFVPSINVFLLALPLKSILAFLVLSVYLGTIITYINGYFTSFEDFIVVLKNVFQ